MKTCFLACVGFIMLHLQLFAMDLPTGMQAVKNSYVKDTLPSILSTVHEDFIDKKLREEAATKFNAYQLPTDRKEFETFKTYLRGKIIQKAGVVINHQLPLNVRETGIIRLKGYFIKKIAFQTRPGVYATANLYVPDGNGPFPAVIHAHGHWMNSKADEEFIQPVCHSLALLCHY